ncbi:MAG: ATP-binding protein [Bacteroidales bacterium]|nr:ATP-binding protein [Bacteroidales bacterium]
MQDKIIGREEEIKLLNKYASSGKAEFVALYGRRRVGKTFLVNQVFKDRLTFSMTGIMDGDRNAQLHAFADALDLCGQPVKKLPKNWYDAFQKLRHFLAEKIANGKECVVFIDELPCFETRKSNFVNALGYFWNSWASLHDNLLLIVCGSATSWMMKNVIDNHGGLHDRITHEMHLKEFSLRETEEYLVSYDFPWDRTMILQTYMVMGGIPYYLSLLDPAESLAQNIDRLYFQANGEMRREFQRLYKTLFSSPEPYIAIVEALFEKKKGLTRDEIAAAVDISANGNLTKMLQNLVDCDIIRFYRVKNKTIGSRNGLYQLLDFYSLFYLQFMKSRTTNEHFWTQSLNTPAINTWMGLAFERICLTHIPQIMQALRIGGIKSEYYSWRGIDPETQQQAQIDLIIERADRMINLCEAKYSEKPYLLDKEEYGKYTDRLNLFKQHTGFSGGIVPTFITANGLQRNAYSEHIIAQLTMDDLFEG